MDRVGNKLVGNLINTSHPIQQIVQLHVQVYGGGDINISPVLEVVELTTNKMIRTNPRPFTGLPVSSWVGLLP